jgi:hypothetical protein
MGSTNDAQPPAQESGERSSVKHPERSYAAICAGKDLAFDPMKDLNLPASYEEVILRFRRLQGIRAAEVLN